jgi:SAM-dependent methyltransferase
MELIEEFADPKSKILEIGSGTAVVANELAKRGHIVSAVDCYSEEKINEISNKFQQPRLTLHGGGVLFLTEAESAFDLVCSRCTFEHLLDLEEVLVKTTNLLKPGGIFVITGPNYDSIAWPFRGMINMFSSKGPKYFACYTNVWSVLQGIIVGARNMFLGMLFAHSRPFKYFWPRMVNGEIKFERADDDAVCWVSSINLRNFLVERGFKMLKYNQYPVTTPGRALYRLLPHMTSYYRIIARKTGNE